MIPKCHALRNMYLNHIYNVFSLVTSNNRAMYTFPLHSFSKTSTDKVLKAKHYAITHLHTHFSLGEGIEDLNSRV